jgi:hypothetical protein
MFCDWQMLECETVAKENKENWRSGLVEGRLSESTMAQTEAQSLKPAIDAKLVSSQFFRFLRFR